MSWYHTPGKDQDVVVSTRLHLARNLEEYPFVNHMEAKDAEALIQKVGALLCNGGFQKIDTVDMTLAEAHSLVERHYVSPAFIKLSLPHALYLNEPCHLSVILCEEDHIRIRCILSGCALREAFDGVRRIDELLDASLSYAYDTAGTWGYLTANPCHLGTGLYASVLLFLPALTGRGRIEAILSELSHSGFFARAVCDDSLQTAGCLYQISNRITIGMGETQIIDRLQHAVSSICEEERSIRRAVKGPSLDALTDRIWRSWGILKYAHSLSLEEFIPLLFDVRLGVAMGILDQIQMHELTTLFIEAMPATLTHALESEAGTLEKLDAARSALIRKKLKEAL